MIFSEITFIMESVKSKHPMSITELNIFWVTIYLIVCVERNQTEEQKLYRGVWILHGFRKGNFRTGLHKKKKEGDSQ